MTTIPTAESVRHIRPLLTATLFILASSVTSQSVVFAQKAAPVAVAPVEDGAARLRALMVPGGLTSDEVARLAAASSPEIRGRQAGAEAARAREDQATAEFWPRLALTSRYTRLSRIDPPMFPGGGVFPVFVDNYALGASLSVPVSDYLLRTARSMRAAGRSAAAAKLDADASRRKVVADARLTYYDWIGARGQLLVLEQRAETARAQVTDAGRLFEACLLYTSDAADE